MKYYLKRPYRLIGFSDDPFCLLNSETDERKKLSISDFVLLKECCTGFELNETDADYIEDKSRLDEWSHAGVVGNEIEYEQPFGYEYNEYVNRNSIQLAITAKCNYRCLHCLAANGISNESDELSLTLCDRILKEASECHIKNVWLTGGEPLIHPDFLGIVERIGFHGLRLGQILTNGSLITEDILDKIRDLGQTPDFAISFDGIGTHDWMRNVKGAERTALEAFALVRKKGFKASANINVNTVTLPRIIESARMLVKDYGVSTLHPIVTSPSPRWEKMRGTNDTLPLGIYFDSMIELIKISKLEGWDVRIDVLFMPELHNLNNPSFKSYDNPPLPTGREPLMNSCPRAKSLVFVGHDGRVLPCSGYEGVSNAMGIMQGKDLNINYHSLKEILTDSSYLDPFKVTITDLKDNSEKCRDCKWVSICCGGCRTSVYYRYLEDGIYSTSGVNCLFFRGGYAEKYKNMLKEFY